MHDGLEITVNRFVQQEPIVVRTLPVAIDGAEGKNPIARYIGIALERLPIVAAG